MTIRKRVLWPVLLGIIGLFIGYDRGYEVPILMYHHVGNTAEDPGLNVSLEAFERQMEFLKIHHYRVLSLWNVVELIRSQKRIPRNSVVITFDDGHLDNLTNAFPVLKKMRFKAMIFLITDNIGKDGWMSEEDLKILDASGISIGSHTVHHAFLPELNPSQQRVELQESRNRLERILGHPVFLLSYPAGGLTRSIRDSLAEIGYQGAVTTNYGTQRRDLYALHRIKITERDGNLFRFWGKLSGVYHLGKRRITLS